MADPPRQPEPNDAPDRSDKPSAAAGDNPAGWYRLVGVGSEFVGMVGVFGLIGWWLDGRFGTGPWLLVSGVAVGFAAGLWIMIRQGMKSFRS